jgi:hypothetical protein
MKYEIKIGGYAAKNVYVEDHWSCGPVVDSWGPTEKTSKGNIPLRVLKVAIKTVLVQAGVDLQQASREARAQARYKKTTEDKRWKKRFANRVRFPAL